MAFNVTSGSTTDLQTVELSNQKGDIVGNVKISGQIDHSNIIIYAKSRDGSVYTTLTNSDGSYLLTGVAAGSGYSVIASGHDLKSFKVDNLEVIAGSTTGVATITLEDIENTKGTIEGFAYFDEITDLQHQGIIVSIAGTDLEAVTAKDGSYIITNIPAGSYTINYTDSNHQPVAKESVVVVAGASSRLEDVSLIGYRKEVTVTINEDTPIENRQLDPTLSDDDSGFSFAINTEPSNGIVTVSADGIYTYTPNSNFYGEDAFSYKVYDGTNYSLSLVVNININSLEDTPKATLTSFSATEDIVYSGDFNATDGDGDTLNYTIVDDDTMGTVVNSEDSFTYTPEGNFTGTDSFYYQVDDGTNTSPLKEVTITVAAVNDAPIGTYESAYVAQDGSLTDTLTAIDVDNSTSDFTFGTVTGSSHGSLTLNSNGSFTYTPDGGYTGSDSFGYTVYDGDVNSSEKTVSLTVVIGTPPVATASSFSVNEDSVLSENLVATDSDGSVVLYEIVNAPAHGDVNFTTSTQSDFKYTPDTNFDKTDSFTFRAKDNSGFYSAVKTVTITVNGVNDAPSVTSSSVEVNENKTFVMTVSGEDVDGDDLTFELNGGADEAKFSLTTAGVLTFDNPSDYENPTDLNEDNDYEITVRAKDGNSSYSQDKDLTITVNDVENPTIIGKLYGSSSEAEDGFGQDVAISGDYAVVGAWYDDGENNLKTNSGAVYVYKKGSEGEFNQIAILRASDPEKNDEFGYAVAIDGDYIVVGAYRKSNYVGAVYVFKNDGSDNFTQYQKITDTNTNPDYFGWSVAIEGNYLVIGASMEDKTEDSFKNNGMVYVFKNNGTTFERIAYFRSEETEEYEYFGTSVAISGDTIVIGAHGNNAAATDDGKIYVYEKDGSDVISYKHTLYDSNAANDDHFGRQVAMDDIDGTKYIVASSRDNSDGATLGGSATVFKGSISSGFERIQKLMPSEIAEEDRFGHSIGISGRYVVVGAKYDDGGDTNGGAIYIYKLKGDGTGFELVKELNSPDVQAYDHLGSGVAIDGDTFIAGADDVDDKGTRAGAAYIGTIEPLEKPYIINYENNVTVFDSDSSGNLQDYLGTSTNNIPLLYSLSGTNASSFDIDSDGLLTASGGLLSAGSYSLNLDVEDQEDATAQYTVNVESLDGFTLENLEKISGDTTGGKLGYAVDSDGDYIIVGAPVSAKAYLYKKNVDDSLTLVRTITSTESADEFGYSVAISGDYYVVGKRKDDAEGTDAGAVYLYKISDESFYSKITQSRQEAYDYFGSSIDIDGKYIVIGAPGDDGDPDNDVGSAYVFEIGAGDSVSYINKIFDPYKAAYDHFGVRVRVNEAGQYVVIGANDEDGEGFTDNGKIQIYKWNGTTFDYVDGTTRRSNEDDNKHGYSLTIDRSGGEYIAVSSTYNDERGERAGRVHVYKWDGSNITDMQILYADDAKEQDNFGYAVDLNGDYLVVGATQEGQTENNPGKMYVFKKDANGYFQQVQKFTAPDGAAGDALGRQIAVSGDIIAVGAHRADPSGKTNAGAVYVIKIVE